MTLVATSVSIVRAEPQMNAAGNTCARTGDRNPRELRILMAIVGLAVAIRLLAVAAFPLQPVSDALTYHGLAVRLTDRLGYVTEKGEPTAFRAPGYPAFLASVYFVFGRDPRVGSTAQAVLGGVTVALLFWLTRLTVGNAEAHTAGLLAAVYPGLVWLPRALLSENLVMPLLLLSLCAAAVLLKSRRHAWAVVAGVSLAMATLTRPGSLLLVLLLCPGLVVCIGREAGFRPACGVTVTTLLAFGACLTPWAYRNQLLFERGPVLSTSGGITLYASYWPPRLGAKRIWGDIPGPEDPAVAAAARAGNEAVASARLTEVTMRRLMDRPAHFISLWPVKTMWLLAPFDWDWFPREPGRTRSFNLAYVILLVPAAAGFVGLLARPRKRQWLLWLLPAAALLQALIFYGGPRFRLPAESSLLIVAAVGLAEMWHGGFRRWLSIPRVWHERAETRRSTRP